MNKSTLLQLKHSSEIILRLYQSIEDCERGMIEFKDKPKYWTLEHALRNFKFDLEQEQGVLRDSIKEL